MPTDILVNDAGFGANHLASDAATLVGGTGLCDRTWTEESVKPAGTASLS